MAAIVDVACPPFEMAVTLVLVAHPVRFTLEHFGVPAVPRASEGLYVFVHVLRPVGGFLELFVAKAKLTFKLGRKRSSRWHGDALGEAIGGYTAVKRRSIAIR